MAKSLFGGSGPRVVVDPEGVAEFLNQNKDFRDLLVSTAQEVKAYADATAQEAQAGSGGRLTGYAEAGFTVQWDARGRRPRVNIVSNADPETYLRVHMASQKRWGVAHLRRALYSITSRGA